MSPQQGRKIAMVGATGTIGTPTLAALLNQNIHAITAITRNESSATFPPSVTVLKGDYTDSTFLTSALSGQDILLMQLNMSPSSMSSQTLLINAAAAAGVRWVLPTEFGSDIESTIATDFAMTGGKKVYRDLIEEKGMKWIAVVNNPWFDWSLERGMWGVDIGGRKATLFEGTKRFNTTTLGQVGKGVANLLSLPDSELEKFTNKPVYLRSFHISQQEMFDSVLRATGTVEAEWAVERLDPEVAIKASRDAVAGGNPMAFIGEFYVTHMLDGRGGDYEDKAKKHAEVLGLEAEDLDKVVRRVVAELGVGK